jgi:DNA-binding transcriptional LysR family regulator
VAAAVENRRADFGFTPDRLSEEQERGLSAEAAYSLEMRLVTPKGHPLARRRTVRPSDLRRYPMVNGPDEYITAYGGPLPEGDETGPRRDYIVRADFAASIRRLVQLGFGIGLIPAAPSAPPNAGFHERPMGRYFGKLAVYLIRRRGAFTPPAGEAFIELVRSELA